MYGTWLVYVTGKNYIWQTSCFSGGGANNIPFPTSFQNSISALYSYRAPVQPALGLLCTCCTHEPVLRFICGVWAQHVQRCSEQASRYNIQLSDRTSRLWWVTDQNKDGAKCGCDVLEGRSTRLSFFLVLCLSYHFKWQNLFIFLCWTFHCVNSKMLNEFSILTRLIK